MKVLVTGCFGFIGSNLVPELLKEGYEVTGVDNLFQPSINPTDRMKAVSGDAWEKFTFQKGDVRDSAFLQNLFMAVKPTAVIHLAAVGSVPRSFANPNATMDVNVQGFVKLMQTMALAKCSRLVYASSSSVYGDAKGILRNEGQEGRCLSPYALSKKLNEDFARVWGVRYGVRSVGLRFFNVYGPGQRADLEHAAVIPRFINEDEPQLNGDGNTTRDFTFVGDVADAIRKSLQYVMAPSFDHTVLNVGTGQGTSLKMLLQYLGKTPIINEARPGDIDYSVASTQMARAILDWHARVGIEDGLKITREFYEKAKAHERSKEAQSPA